MKNIRIFLSENFHFLVVKFSVYLNKHVFVMRIGHIDAALLPTVILAKVYQTAKHTRIFGCTDQSISHFKVFRCISIILCCQ